MWRGVRQYVASPFMASATLVLLLLAGTVVVFSEVPAPRAELLAKYGGPPSRFITLPCALPWGGELEPFGRDGGTAYIERPKRLVFDLGVPAPSPERGRVVIGISADGAGGLLTLTQEMPEQFARYAGRTQQGWTMTLGNLAKVLDQRTETRPGYGTLRAVLVALVASALAGRPATRADPMVTLHHD